MAERICAWRDEPCGGTIHGVGLCKRHHQMAGRRGILDTYRAARRCRECAGPLPDGCRSSRWYCGRHCANVVAWREGKSDRLAARRRWWMENSDRRESARLAVKAGRKCEECAEALPASARWNRRYCSRRCINAVSLRQRAVERHENAARYRALRLAASCPGVRASDWSRLVARHGHRCAYCLAMVPLTMDHVVPLSRGGRHAIGNLLPACRSCNSSKRDRLLVEWTQRYARAS